MRYASHVPTDKQDAEDKSWVWKPEVTLWYLPKLGIPVFLMAFTVATAKSTLTHCASSTLPRLVLYKRKSLS